MYKEQKIIIKSFTDTIGILGRNINFKISIRIVDDAFEHIEFYFNGSQVFTLYSFQEFIMLCKLISKVNRFMSEEFGSYNDYK